MRLKRNLKICSVISQTGGLKLILTLNLKKQIGVEIETQSQNYTGRGRREKGFIREREKRERGLKTQHKATH